MDHNGLADPYVKLHLLPGASKVRRLSLPSPFPGISLGNLVMVPRWAAVSPGAAGASPRDRGSLGAAMPPHRPSPAALGAGIRLTRSWDSSKHGEKPALVLFDGLVFLLLLHLKPLRSQ